MVLNHFLCGNCGAKKEYSYRNENIDDLRCKECGSAELKIQLSAPSIATLNTKERINTALKKRSMDDHKKKFDDRLEAAKEKYDKKLI